MEEKLLTIHEVASILRLAPKSLYNARWRKDGPPAIKLGHSIRYSEIELWKWINSQRGK